MTKSNLTITYGTFRQDEDDPEMKYLEPNYNIIAFSTEDNDSVSIPTLFFIPKDIKLPDTLYNGRFVRCSFESGVDYNEGVEIVQWLATNSDHKMKINKFVVGVNRPIEKLVSDMLPRFII